MQVFVPSLHHLHTPQWTVADGTVRPCPDQSARVDRIREALEKAGHQIIATETQASPAPTPSAIDNQKSKTARPAAPVIENSPDPWPAIRRVHKSDYLHYLQTIHALWTAEFGAGVDVIPDTFPRPHSLRHAHGAPVYAQRVSRPSKPVAQAGFYCFDMAAPITAGTWTAAVNSARCAVRAADAVAHGQRAAYALCRPPGHHAGPDYCGGFCYLNNAAIAAQYLVLAGKKRVAILDLDYHHGNGTQDIFYTRDDVLFVSLHADPNTQYPYFWGYATEHGEWAGAGFTHNFPLPRGTREAQWLDTFARALECVVSYAPEALVISLGVDTHEKDTVGDFGLTLDGFATVGRELDRLKSPMVFIQEGGYNVDTVGPCVTAILKPKG
jgi:acetoin utilization deacetylase AcuC-like enzyme